MSDNTPTTPLNFTIDKSAIEESASGAIQSAIQSAFGNWKFKNEIETAAATALVNASVAQVVQHAIDKTDFDALAAVMSKEIAETLRFSLLQVIEGSCADMIVKLRVNRDYLTAEERAKIHAQVIMEMRAYRRDNPSSPGDSVVE